MRSSRIDQWLVSLGILLVLISSYYLFWFQEGARSGLSLGRLSATTAIVKTKSPFTLDWRDAFTGLDVSENQLVYTDRESSADIVFTSGDEVKVGENSLIRITGSGHKAGMDVGQGLINAKVRSGEPLEIKLNGEEYTISSKDADVQINLLEGKGEIGVSNGSVKVEREGKTDELTSSSILEIEGNQAKVMSVAYSLLAPVNKSQLSGTDEDRPVKFEWTPGEKATLEVTNLQTKKTQTFETESGHVVSLREGAYQWRLKSEKGASLTSSFEIFLEKPLNVLRPKTGDVVEAFQDKNESKILLQWEGLARDHFQIESRVDGVIHQEEVKGNHHFLTLTGNPSKFEWRARLLKKGRETLWSEWQAPTLKILPPPSMPTKLNPHEVEFQIFNKDRKTAIPLSWKAETPVSIEIEEPQGMTTIWSQTNEAIYSTRTPGKYRWRAIGLDRFKRESQWTEWKTFEVVDLSGEVKKGEWQRIQLKKPDQEVSFEWFADKDSTSIFEMSKDPDFKDIVKTSEVKGNHTKVVVPKTGTYYWRSRLYKADGTYEVSDPHRVIIEQGPPPGKPEKLPDMEVPLHWEEVNKQTGFRWWHLFIAPAYADDEQGIATFKIPKNEDAKAYHLRIFRKADSTNPVFEKEISSNEFNWVGAEPGEYQWQYAIVDFWGRMSPFSDLSQLTIVGEQMNRPLLASPIRAQEVAAKNLKFDWTESQGAVSYDFQIAQDEKFNDLLLLKKGLKSTSFALSSNERMKPGMYYWQVKAKNKQKQQVPSSVGRFVIIPAAEEATTPGTLLAERAPFQKRVYFGWIPSKEDVKFSDNNENGKISGNTLMSFLARGHLNLDSIILSAEGVRQSGKVFKGQSYLFQKVQLDAGLKWERGIHRLALGAGLAQISSYEYQISTTAVSASSVSSLSYGPVIRGFHQLQRTKEIQSKFAYLLAGTIKEMELGADLLNHQDKFFWAVGLSYLSREIGEGNQTSMRVSLGLGKDF
jgi:hypothetical protein